MNQNETKFTLDMVLIENQKLGLFTAYFTQFPEIIADGVTQTEAEENLLSTLRFFLEYKTRESASDTPQNHVIRKSIDFNCVEA